MRLPTATFFPFALTVLAAPSFALADTARVDDHDYGDQSDWTREVVGGSPVSPGQWPDTAGVFFSGELGCTGTLVAPKVVLTAGHCIDPSIDKVLLNSTDTAAGGEEIQVVQSIAYPNWETSYDVGILILASASSIPPRMIARGCALSEFYAPGAPVELVGYGATDVQGTQFGTRLLGGSAMIIDADCSGNGCNASVSPGGELIAGGGGVDSCFGDSGGPVYLRSAKADYLIGVTSRGLDDSTTPCGGGGIYTRADAVAGWIEQEAGVVLAMADCQNDGNAGTDPGEPGEPGNGEPGDGGNGGNGSGGGGEGGGSGMSQGGIVTSGCSSSGGNGGAPLALLAIALFTLAYRPRKQEL